MLVIVNISKICKYAAYFMHDPYSNGIVSGTVTDMNRCTK